MKNKTISIVIPCHNEEKNLSPLVKEIIKEIPKKYNYEIILVDDGSNDKTEFEIYKLSKKNKNIKGIILYRNFGHQLALISGINFSHGDAVITMDADFQHPPSMLPKIIAAWEDGHDFVQLQKDLKRTSKLHPRKIAYKVWEIVSAGTLTPGGSDFRLISKQIANYIRSSEEREIFIRGITKLMARNPINLIYKVAKRRHGKSSYTFKMFLNMFITGFISFSTFPLRIGSFFGMLIALSSALVLIFDIVKSIFLGQRIIEGYVSIVFLMLVLNGFIIFYMGVLAEYIGVIFREVKKRPKYIVKDIYNLEK